MKVFGPVPSRRLGQSMGINNVPFKHCTYSCVYCQLGRTNNMIIKRRKFYNPDDILKETEEKMIELKKSEKAVDYITFVCDGEPTLDINLGTEIKKLKKFGTKIAIITNASLLSCDDVKDDLMNVDWVSLKIDSVEEEVWKKIDRPHGNLNLDKILEGIKDFSKNYKNTLVTETMLVNELNDKKESIRKIGEYLFEIKPSKSYLLVPTKPPAEKWVAGLEMDKLLMASNIIYNASGVNVECIYGEEGYDFYFGDNTEKSILSIVSVHPIREEVLMKILNEKNHGKEVVENLIKQEKINRFKYEGHWFYVKKFF